MVYVLVIGMCLHLSYWILIFTRLVFYQDTYKKNDEPVDVVSACKNEINNLPGFIDFLQNQDYRNYDITLVDDYSTDGSSSYLHQQQNIKIIKPSRDLPGKKLGLQEAIINVNHKYVLVTDVDCRGSHAWIDQMMGTIGKKEIILGYAPLRSCHTLASRFASYETWLAGIQYLSYAVIGIPYMGVGRNLLFTKNLFLKNKGYQSHFDLASGDDDLFINEVANGNNTGICLHHNSFMYSDAPVSWSVFLRQKQRHLSTATRYKKIHQCLLAGFSSSHILFYIAFMILLFTDSWQFALACMIIKWLIQAIISFPIMNRLKEIKLWWWIPVFDVILFLYYVGMAPFTLIKKRTTWN